MIRTLVVDDDYRIAAIHRAYTERIPGFTVVGEARSAAAALVSIEQLRPDLVLLDIYLPDRSGLDLLADLRQPGREPIDVIAITSANDVASLRSALQHGVVHYLVKPFDFNALREKLESYQSFRERLQRLRDVNQQEVDRISSILRPPPADALPKGLSATTLELVAEVVRETPASLSAAEVALRLGISRVTARRYLEYLCRYARVEMIPRYGTSGRPEHRFRWVVPIRPGQPCPGG